MTKTYLGSCHCAAIKFEIDSEPIESAIRCTCSICRRRHSLMSPRYYKPDEFRVTSGKDELSLYEFGDRETSHHFCPRCGVYVFHTSATDPTHGYRVNLGCLDGLDIFALPVRTFDGADTWTFLD